MNPRQYVLNLNTKSGAFGNYALTLNAAGSGIRDAAGNFLGISVTERWTKNPPPALRVATASSSIAAPVNNAPINITLSHSSVSENVAGATIGTLTVADPDIHDKYTFTVSDLRFEVVRRNLEVEGGHFLGLRNRCNR